MSSEGNENVVTKEEAGVEAVAEGVVAEGVVAEGEGSQVETSEADNNSGAENNNALENQDTTENQEVATTDNAVVSDEQVEVFAEEEVSTEEVTTEEQVAVSGEADSVDSGESKPRNPDLRWYVVNAYSGYESKVKVALEDRIRSNGMENLFGEIQVPQETVVELVKGQKKTSNRKFFPGYVLVEMVLNEDTWHLIKETPKVSGFVGDKTSPMPLEEDEVKRILNQVEEGAASPASKIKFEEGETVKVTDGPFSDFNGTVEEVNQQKGKLKVLISIFGRATPVELDFIQVEKLQKV